MMSRVLTYGADVLPESAVSACLEAALGTASLESVASHDLQLKTLLLLLWHKSQV